MRAGTTIRETGRWLKRARLRALRASTGRRAHYNSLLNQREVWQGRARLDSFPREIQVGTNWTCDLRCPFCRRQSDKVPHLRALKADEREISRSAMDRLLAVMPYAEVFTLTPLGEPLLVFRARLCARPPSGIWLPKPANDDEWEPAGRGAGEAPCGERSAPNLSFGSIRPTRRTTPTCAREAASTG